MHIGQWWESQKEEDQDIRWVDNIKIDLRAIV
jgi:hypothetical protein